MLGEMFDLDQTSPNIAKHDVRSPNKVCKRSNISPNMMLDQVLGEMLDRLHKPLESNPTTKRRCLRKNRFKCFHKSPEI